MSETSGADKKYFGKYRGTVVDNLDLEMRGRILAMVPDVFGIIPSSWCEACVPLSGPSGPPMGTYFVPPIGAAVWIEFEQGDPSYPIFAGCRFAFPADVPPLAKAGLPVSPSIVLQTLGQNSLILSDLPGPTGGIMLKSLTGATLIVNDTGIYLQNGKGAMLTLLGPTVAINGTALAIT